MIEISGQRESIAPQTGWRLPEYLHGLAKPSFWLLVGLIASLGYNYAAYAYAAYAANLGPSAPELPYPFFPPQAVILCVLLITPIRHWWFYLATYYVVLVLDGLLTS